MVPCEDNHRQMGRAYFGLCVVESLTISLFYACTHLVTINKINKKHTS